ncbi:MAG: class I SAM-dependent methyltransferase [Actinomycetota bacterium]
MVDSPYPELKKTHTMAHVGRPWTDYKPPTSAPVWDVVDGFGRFHALVTALELDVFEAIERAGRTDAHALALELDVSAPHLDALLDAVVAMGFLERRAGGVELNDTARRYLLRDGAASMVDLIPVSPGPLENWRSLTDTVRKGRPARPVEDDPAAFYVPLVEGTFTTIMRCARRADLQLRYTALDRPRVLDLGAGGAPWTIAILGGNSGATAVVNDLPGVIDVARRTVVEHDVADRVEFLPGDYHHVDIEDAAYDIVVLGHVLRAEGREAAPRLLARAHRAVRPGGRVVVGDYFTDARRTAATGHALMMGTTMMASTEHGATFSHDEVGSWLRDVGFTGVRVVEPIGFQQVVIGDRPTVSGEQKEES